MDVQLATLNCIQIRVVDCFLVDKKKGLYRIVIALLILYHKNADKVTSDDMMGSLQKLLDFFQNIPVPVEKVFKIAYGIRGFSEKIVNQQLVKVQMTLKSQANLSERSMSADRLPSSQSAYHLQVNSSAQPVIRELRLDSLSRTRSVGVVALGNFKSSILTAEQLAAVSTLLINKSWKNLLPNFIDSEVEENVQTEEIQLASLINQLQNMNPMFNTETHAEADNSLARNEILTDNKIIRTVTAEDDDDDDVTPANPVKISHSEAVTALNTSLLWAEEQNF
ncbi:hypothetical protein AVEN_216306-1 [Araneus ventricosus]|uniref:Uncharacterized protein n=1 Tax=Araneus ventricosus TaxID=182803 RepID=A0A4Y2PZC8_ARAVE|nr:hypothetical protein AVEN_26834-1 [Araneus ventricosus]GBN56247.1 hypothetical protein AVEN_216306-1 [Araneus ventricosus]